MLQGMLTRQQLYNMKATQLSISGSMGLYYLCNYGGVKQLLACGMAVDIYCFNTWINEYKTT